MTGVHIFREMVVCYISLCNTWYSGLGLDQEEQKSDCGKWDFIKFKCIHEAVFMVGTSWKSLNVT